MEVGEKITLCVKKRTPSLNTFLRWSPWERLKEKREMTIEVGNAIESALYLAESESATPTISLGGKSILSMRSGLQELYLKMTQTRSSSKSPKKRSKATRTKRRGWR